MSKTLKEIPSGADVKNNPENNPEKLLSVLREMGRAAMKAAKETWRTMTGRDSGEQAKDKSDTSGTIAPKAPVQSGDTSPTSEERLKSLEELGVEVITTPEYPVYPEPSLPKSVTTPDGRQHPVYPEPSLPKSVTTPDGRQHPVESGNTPAAKTEPSKTTSRDIPGNWRRGRGVVGGAAAAEAEPPKPKRTKWKNRRQFTVDNAGNTPTTETNGDTEKNPEKTEMSVEEYEVATTLKLARERFAKASIAVETHFFKEHFGGKKRQAELEAATKQLKQSELEYMRIKFADEIEAAKQDADKQAELAAEIAQAAFANMQETSKRTSERYDEMLDGRNKFKKYAAKVGEWFTKGGKVSQWLKLGGAGFAVGTTTVAFAGWPITTTTFVATKLAVAGALKQNILEERRGEDRIAKGRPDYLDSSFAKGMAGKEADYVMNRAVDMSVDELKDVSVKRQEDLYRRIGSGLVKYTIGFGLGGLAGNWLSSTYATGDSVPQSGIEDSVPQSGIEDSVPQSGNGAVDTGVPTPEAPNVPEINFDSYDYPWDWAAEKFSDANAMDQLHNLADKAMANGHTVEWFNNPDGSVWMKVDGSSATADVLKVLNKYA